MWHYVFTPGEPPDWTPALANAVESCLREAGITELEVREPYFFAAGQIDVGLHDGAKITPDRAMPIVRAAIAEDLGVPYCKFEGPGGSYVNYGWDYDVYVGTPQRCPQAEDQAERAGLRVDVDDRPSPYLNPPGTPADPPADARAWAHLRDRVAGEPLFVLERWAGGPFGERGHLLTEPADVDRMVAGLLPRCALAVFSAAALIPVPDAIDRSGYAEEHGDGRVMHLVYETGPGEPWFTVGLGHAQEIGGLLADVPYDSPRALAKPRYPADWRAPEVEIYVRPDSDGVVRTRLGYHFDFPEDDETD